jgi:hypothetical protein
VELGWMGRRRLRFIVSPISESRCGARGRLYWADVGHARPLIAIRPR